MRIFLVIGFLLMFPLVTTSSMEEHVDLSSALLNGCKDLQDTLGRLDCHSAGVEKKYSCLELRKTDNLGGLTPRVPIMECFFENSGQQSGEKAIRVISCGMETLRSNYVVFADKTFTQMKSPDEFRAFFAPISSSSEALSYAVALTGSYPLLEVQVPQGYESTGEPLVPTSVIRTKDGYVVHLFNFQCSGCGPHFYFSIDYLVTETGQLRTLLRQDLYRNPAEDKMCMD